MSQVEIKSNNITIWTDLFEQVTPKEYSKYPIEGHPEILNWKRHITHNFIWLAIGPIDFVMKDYVYCSECEKWVIFRNNSYYISRHLLSHKDVEVNYHEKEIKNSSNILKNVKKSLKSYLILSGAPFSHIEDPHLRAICPNLPNRQNFSKEIEDISKKTSEAIRKELEIFKFISLTFDEWEDLSKRRYLGITAVGTSNFRIGTYTLALVPLLERPCTAFYMSNLIKEIILKYNIDSKIQCLVTDSASVMIATANNLIYNRLPCICHIFNLFIGEFLNAESTLVSILNSYQSDFSTSKFVALAQKLGSKKRRVSNYINIRWYSFVEMLIDFKKMKKVIEQYSYEEKKTQVKKEVWEAIDKLLPFFKTCSECIKKQESEDFGNISYLALHLSKIRKKLNELPVTFQKGVNAYKAKENEYFSTYSLFWTPLIYSAARLNPHLSVTEFLSQEEIEMGDQLILEKMKLKKKLETNEKPVEINIPKNINQEIDFSSDFEDQEDKDFGCHILKKLNDNEKIFEEYKKEIHISNLDLYEFWKNHMNLYPSLSEVAIEILSIQVTSASSERMFSVTRRILGYRRLSLSQDHVEDLALIMNNQEISKQFIK